MPEPDICSWSDLPASQCAHCLEHELLTNDNAVLQWFDARFASQLACGHQAVTGQTIGVTVAGEYVCRRCGR